MSQNQFDAIKADGFLSYATNLGAYTAGFSYTLEHPELTILGLPAEICHQYFWTAFHAIQKGGFQFRPGQMLYRFMEIKHPFAVIEVANDQHQRLCSLIDFYEAIEYQKPIKVLQLVPCDRQYRFPWDIETDLQIPILGRVPAFTEQVDMHAILMRTKPTE